MSSTQANMKLYDVKNLGEAGVFQKAKDAVGNFARGAVNQVKNANQPLKIGKPQAPGQQQPLKPQAPQQQPAQPAAQANGQQAAQQFVEIVQKNGANLKIEDIKMIRQQLNALLKQKQPQAPTQKPAGTPQPKAPNAMPKQQMQLPLSNPTR